MALVFLIFKLKVRIKKVPERFVGSSNMEKFRPKNEILKKLWEVKIFESRKQ